MTPTGDEHVLRQMLEHVPVSLLATDTAGIVTYAAGLSASAGHLVGRPLVEAATDDHQVELIRRALAGEEITEVVDWDGRFYTARYRSLVVDGVRTGVVAAFSDVTEQVVAERARAEGEAHLKAVIEAAQEAILVLDTEGRLRSANARFTRLFGRELPPGTLLVDVLPEEGAAVLSGQLARRATGESDRYEIRLDDVGGTPVWLLVSASPMLGPSGEFLGSVAVLTDITAHKREQHRLEAVALVDPVTGVANRATLADRLEHALTRREGGVVGVLFCDVDELKAANDRFGHAAGDDLLRHVADRISSVLRPADSVARYAGDEFVIVCEDLPDAREAMVLAERVRCAVAVPFTSGDGHRIRPTLSIGVASAPPVPRTAAELLGAADGAAYAAKRAGRNRVCVSGP